MFSTVRENDLGSMTNSKYEIGEFAEMETEINRTIKKTIIMRFDIQGGCDFKHTIILVITLQVAEDPLHLPLGGFLMGVIHFLQLTT